MADKKTTNKKETKKVSSAKKLGIIASAVAAVIVAVLVIVLVRSVPKKIKTEVESAVIKSYLYEVNSLTKEKTFKPEKSEYDKETIYLVSGRLKSTDKERTRLNGGYVIALVSVTSQNGEENIEVSIVNPFKRIERPSFEQTLTELKNAPADWQARFE